MKTDNPFVNSVTKALFIMAFGLYLYCVWQIGLISRDHANFTSGAPSVPPVIPPAISIIVTTLGAALAVNFGAVLGISVPDPDEVSGKVRRRMNPPTPRFGEEAEIEYPFQTIWRTVVTVAVTIYTTLVTILKKIAGFNPRYWAVVVYLLSLIIGVVFYIQDGGFSQNPGTIPSELANFFLTTVGVLGAALSNLQKS